MTLSDLISLGDGAIGLACFVALGRVLAMVRGLASHLGVRVDDRGRVTRLDEHRAGG